MIPFLLLASAGLWFLTRAQQTPVTPAIGASGVVSNAQPANVAPPMALPPVRSNLGGTQVAPSFWVDTGDNSEFNLKNPEPVAVFSTLSNFRGGLGGSGSGGSSGGGGIGGGHPVL